MSSHGNVFSAGTGGQCRTGCSGPLIKTSTGCVRSTLIHSLPPHDARILHPARPDPVRSGSRPAKSRRIAGGMLPDVGRRFQFIGSKLGYPVSWYMFGQVLRNVPGTAT